MESARQNKQITIQAMKYYIVPGFIIIISLFLFSHCYYDSKEYLYPSLDVCDTTNVTYSVSVKQVLTDNCLSCHSNSNASKDGGSIKLENYADVKVAVDNGSLLGSVMHTSGYVQMPKGGGSLSPCNLVIIQKWISNQAPNN
jgi:hypothetical protein